MPLLLTERLRIRPLTPDDAAVMLALLNDPDWLVMIGDRGVRTLDDARRYIEQGPIAMYAQHGVGFDLVERLDDGRAIGLCGLAQRDYLDARDIGYAYLPAYRGQGYAVEAGRAVLHDAATRLGLRRVLATTRPENLPSQRVLERLGLRHERNIPHPSEPRELRLYATTLD